MGIEDCIINDIKIRNPGENIGDLQEFVREETISHLPVMKDGIYLGSISVNDIRTFDPAKTLAEYQYALEGFFARNTDYWLDTLETFARNQTNILPVLNLENEYLGYLELSEIMSSFNETPFLNEPGGIIVMEKGSKEYSFSEISQIIESHNGSLLGIFVSSKEDSLTRITAKISSSGLNVILQTLRRYGYNIVSEHQEDNYNQSIDERSEYLGKYLNI